MSLALILTADLPCARVDVATLSEGTIMEIIISEMADSVRSQFQNANGDFLDHRMWRGIECTEDGHIQKIDWSRARVHGSIRLDALPPKLQYLDLEKPHKGEFFTGTFQAAALPKSVVEVSLSFNKFHGTIDWENFPKNIWRIQIAGNSFEGSIATFPPSADYIDVSDNKFEGSLNLSALPEPLRSFEAQNNRFAGEIDLRALPSMLRVLDVSQNKLTGSINLDSLPIEIEKVCLNDNVLEGVINAATLPRGLSTLNVRNNRLHGQIDYDALPPHIYTMKVEGNEFDAPCLEISCGVVDGEMY